MHPRYELEREYAVRVIGELQPVRRMERCSEGIELEDGPATSSVDHRGGGEGTNRWYRVTLNEGPQPRGAAHVRGGRLTVSRLMRVRYGPVSCRRASSAASDRELTARGEVRALLKALPPEKPAERFVAGMIDLEI
jgi:23S rRNA pseudouridine2605 synthase